jgi:hypothetical protein
VRFRIAILRSAAILRVVFLAIDAARLLVGLVLQPGAFAAVTTPSDLARASARFRCTWPAARRRASGRVSSPIHHAVVDARALVVLARIEAGVPAITGAVTMTARAGKQDRLLHDSLL